MSKNKVEKKTGFAKGSSNTVGLESLFVPGVAAMDFDPEALIYTWSDTEGKETSGLGGSVKGNDDFPGEGFDLNFGETPSIDAATGHFVPDIRSPGEGVTEHPEAGAFGDGSAVDLESIPDDVKSIVVLTHAGNQGGSKDPP